MRLAAVVAGLAAAMLLTGCDSMPSDAGATGTATNQVTRPSNLLTFGDLDGATSTMWVLEEGTERTPVKKLYGVFRRSQTSREVGIAPPCSMAGAGQDRGEPIRGLTKILLRGVGPHQNALIAQPMTSDAVALGLSPDGSASCGAAPMTADGLILAAELQDGVAVVYGMVGDGVDSLDLVVDGVRHHARLGENGFAQEIPDASGKVLERMILSHADGSVTEFPTD